MRFKWLYRGIGLLAWLPQALLAVGLGEITVHSTLNQALDAEIQILNVNSGELPQDLKPELASQQEFDTMHLARPFWLTRMQFQIEKKTDDSYCIHLRSATPIREPIVNFLLKLKTPDGSSLLKEYLFFLDLPDMDDEKNQLQFKQEILGEFQHKTEAIKKTANPFEEKIPTKDSSLLINDLDKPIKKEGATSAELAFRTSYGPTTAEDSLETIVTALKDQYPNASAEQIMLGIVSKNPLSFQSGDVNQMRADMILELPDEKSVTAVPVETAKSIVQYQKQQQPYRTPTPASTPVVAQFTAPTATPDPQKVAQPEIATTQAPAIAPKPKKPIESPEPVVIAQPEITTPEPTVLAEPEKLSVSAQVSEPVETLTEGVEPVVEPMPTIEPISPPVVSEPPVSAEQALEMLTSDTKATEKAVASTKLVVPQPEPLSFWDQYGWMLLLGGGMFALLPGVFLLQRARTKRQRSTEASALDRLELTETAGLEEVQAEQSASTDLSDPQTPSRDLDPLEAAQHYVEEESSDQAEHVLQRALLTDPNNLSIIRKLIEIYASNDKTDNIAALVSRVPATVRQKDPKAWMFIHSVCRTFGIPCEKVEEHWSETKTVPETVQEIIPEVIVEPVTEVSVIEKHDIGASTELIVGDDLPMESIAALNTEIPTMIVEEELVNLNVAELTPMVELTEPTIELTEMSDTVVVAAPPVEEIPMMMVEEALISVEVEEPETGGFKLAALDTEIPVQAAPKKQETLDIDTSSLRLLDPDADVSLSVAKKTPDETQSMTSVTPTQALIVDSLTAVDTDDETLVNEIIFEPVNDIEEPPPVSAQSLTEEPAKTEAYLDPDDLQAKLELAKRYIEMGEIEDARELLTDLVIQGDSEQRRIALELIERL